MRIVMVLECGHCLFDYFIIPNSLYCQLHFIPVPSHTPLFLDLYFFFLITPLSVLGLYLIALTEKKGRKDFRLETYGINPKS